MIPPKILLATDFSENSRPARNYAVCYAKAFDADLLILHVINSTNIGYPTLEEGVPMDISAAIESIQESVGRALEVLARECSDGPKSVDTTSRLGSPAYEIVRFADEISAGLIVMGTHGWSGFKHLIMGSTAENVVRTANCPVLTVRSSARDKV
jgi:universal stress protein A